MKAKHTMKASERGFEISLKDPKWTCHTIVFTNKAYGLEGLGEKHAKIILAALNGSGSKAQADRIAKLEEALREIMRFEGSLRHVMNNALQSPDNFLKALDEAKSLLS